jgi:hypothetical protein
MFGVFVSVFCVMAVEILKGVISYVTDEGVRVSCWLHLNTFKMHGTMNVKLKCQIHSYKERIPKNVLNLSVRQDTEAGFKARISLKQG